MTARRNCFYGLISDDFCPKFSKLTAKSDNSSNKASISTKKSKFAVYWNKNGSFRLHRLENSAHGGQELKHFERLPFFGPV